MEPIIAALAKCFSFKLSLFYNLVCPVFFRFNGFFDEDSTQETLYHNSVCPLIPYVLQGHNASVFAYGPTGAGMSEIEDIIEKKRQRSFSTQVPTLIETPVPCTCVEFLIFGFCYKKL